MNQKIIATISILFINSIAQGQSVYFGKFKYTFQKVRSVEKADRGTYIKNSGLELRHKNFKESLLSFIEIGIRNDSVMSRGIYSFDNKTKKLTIKNYYYNRNEYYVDSSYVVFLQTQDGNFILRQSTDFKDGKKKIAMF